MYVCMYTYREKKREIHGVDDGIQRDRERKKEREIHGVNDGIHIESERER